MISASNAKARESMWNYSNARKRFLIFYYKFFLSECKDKFFLKENAHRIIDLPKDFINGTILIFPGLGNINEKKISGSLKIKLNIVSDKEYSVNENYIEKKIKVSFEKFIKGGQVHFQHPRGKGEFHIVEGTIPGFKKIFPNLVKNFF